MLDINNREILLETNVQRLKNLISKASIGEVVYLKSNATSEAFIPFNIDGFPGDNPYFNIIITNEPIGTNFTKLSFVFGFTFNHLTYTVIANAPDHDLDILRFEIIIRDMFVSLFKNIGDDFASRVF